MRPSGAVIRRALDAEVDRPGEELLDATDIEAAVEKIADRVGVTPERVWLIWQRTSYGDAG